MNSRTTSQSANSGAAIKTAINVGLILGAGAIYLTLVGILQLFDGRELIKDVLTLGQVMLYLPPLISQGAAIVSALLAGLVAAGVILLLTLFLDNIKEIGNLKVRDMFVNASPKTVKILTSDQGIRGGATIIFGVYLVLALFGSILEMIPGLLRKGIVSAITWTLGIGLLSELVIQIMRATTSDAMVRTYFQGKALRSTTTALIILGIALVASIIWSLSRNRVAKTHAGLNTAGKRTLSIVGAVIVLS